MKDKKKEYGDPLITDVIDAMKKYSPLELDLTKDKLPEVFITAGLNDSRVNVLHTLKFVKKLRLHPELDLKWNVLLLKNAGHFVMTLPYQDAIAWRAESVFWSRIYQYLGW